ncbi:MAG: mutS 2 [Deltaproteobacteria bacterium]|nr:mutS 2 [Deltaproteobacteria bacterium]
MKARLLHREEDVDLGRPLPWNEEALTKDLALNTLFNAMARGDGFLFEVAKKIILSGLSMDLATIPYRQEILRDCLNRPAVVRELYAVAVEAMENEKKLFFLGSLERHPDWLLRHSIELSEMFLGTIRKLRKIADSHADEFASEGWTALFATLRRELGDDYLLRVQHYLRQLKFRDGISLKAGLGKGNKGADYTLLLLQQARREGWVARLIRLLERRPPALGFSLHPRDEGGARALEELRNRGISGVANALARSTDHMRSFFGMLRTELAFYVGCVNLHEELARKGEPTCFPLPAAPDERRLSFHGLRETCLALSLGRRVVGNDADADKRDLVMVTGANQGGKSTFLRSVGLAQLMMQSGMFVSADSFRSSVCDSLFTHYKREEDAAMKSGKLDEELRRMSDIVDHVSSRSMILFNESFAATNEREGSEIARQILSALLDKGVRMVCVTHLYELAHGFHRKHQGNILFLRAERETGGSRTFKLSEGEPLQTSFGEDLYDSIFGVGTGR